MDNVKTYAPTDYAAYLLERYAGQNEAEWRAFLGEDARRSSGDRQIPSVLCGGRRYYDLWNVFLFISRREIDMYFTQLAGESGGGERASSHAYAKIGFDASNPKGVGFVELVIGKRQHGNLRLTPDEARTLAVHLFNQADLSDSQEHEASEYRECNETAEDLVNALLIEIGITDPDAVSENTKEVA